MRYLVYGVTKQDAPWFEEVIGPEYTAEPDWDLVVVDLVERKWLWGGEWKSCRAYGADRTRVPEVQG